MCDVGGRDGAAVDGPGLLSGNNDLRGAKTELDIPVDSFLDMLIDAMLIGNNSRFERRRKDRWPEYHRIGRRRRNSGD